MRSTMQSVPLTVSGLLRHGERVHGRSTVCTDIGGDTETRSFLEVAARARRLAAGLRGLGVARDERVATFQWNNAEHVEAYLAVPGMGAILHTLNVRLPADQLCYIVEHAQNRVVIADASLVPALVPVLRTVAPVRHLVVSGQLDAAAAALLDQLSLQVHDYERVLASGGECDDWAAVEEDDAAALCYTSGTTGNPKGVLYSHRSLYLHALSVCTGAALGIGPADRVLAIVPMFHANAWGLVHAAFLSGADLVMPDRYLQAGSLADLMAREAVTVSAGVPTIWAGLLNWAGAGNHVDLRSVRKLYAGGSAVPEHLMRGFRETFGVELVQGSGMTETSPVVTIAEAPPWIATDTPEYWAYRRRAGRLLAGVEARVVGESGAVLPADGQSVGELHYRGPWITDGYYRDDSVSDGWLHTGDVATIDRDGYVTITDRIKDVIKSGGEWISSVALENLLAAHPAVREAAVVAVPDAVWGERPLACVVSDGAGVDELYAYLAGHLPRWQVPEYWALLDEIPRTSVGKWDKRELRARHGTGHLAVQTRQGPVREGMRP